MRFHLSIFSAWAMLTTILCVTSPTSLAQIIPDQTLGEENSVIIPNVNIGGIDSEAPGGAATLRIDGGAVRGSNLFHSFQEFNVDEGRGVYFSNPNNIINILSRVTGGNISQILGTLGVLGNANLFLINPNGIVFGPNARLDVGGSFFATTADGILFENGFEFAASNPEAPPLLTINMPLGLNIRENPGTIVNQSIAQDNEDNYVGLQVPPKRTLGFVGGDIQMPGGILTAPQGRIELGSVEGNSFVSLTSIDKGYATSYEGVQNFRDIAISQEALVDVRGEGGGDIQLQGRRVTLTEASEIEASTQGSEPGGISTIRASESVEVIGSGIFADLDSGATGTGGTLIIDTQRLVVRDGAKISTSTFGNGNGGNLIIMATDVEIVGNFSGLFASVQPQATGNGGTLIIDTQRLSVQDGAKISTSIFGNGNGGNLIIMATDVELIGTSVDGQSSSGLFASVEPGATGNGGTLKLNTQDLSVRDGAQVLTETFGNGNGGNLTINTQDLSVRDGAQISTATFGNGNGGNLTVTATNIEVVGRHSALGASVEVQEEAIGKITTGNGGTLVLNTQNLSVRDGAQIGTGTFSQGNGGNLIVTATNVELLGRGSQLEASVQPGATGNGGTLTLNTQNLSLRDGAQILATTFGSGDGGILIITATNAELVGTSADGQSASRLGASVQPGAIGKGGTIIFNTQNLSLRDGAQIGVETSGQGNAGDLTVTATNMELVGTSVDGEVPSGLAASVQQGATGNSGALTISTQRLLVRDGAQVLTSTVGNGNGGNLTVTAIDVELVGDNSALSSSAFSPSTGRAGMLTVNAENVTVRDGAIIDVRSQTSEAAGNLVINAPSILLDNDASLNANTTAGQGNIIVNTEDLRLRNNSSITTNATGEATGGNIEINTDNLIAIEDSDISANAEAAFGGQVIINANAIFGTQFRTQPTNASDITATSELGPEFSGTVDLNTEIDPSSGLVELPQTVIDPAELIAQDPCKQGTDSEFIITGRGGLPSSPADLQSVNLSRVELIEPATPQPNPNFTQPPQQQSRKRDHNRDDHPVDSRTIVPARGWIRTEDGDVILVSYDPTTTGVQRPPQNSYLCQPSR
ncbi:filamentous hemagglutinin N-terminal domain-containing protein [Capilliphycus salinus ALCB114379]|uniref:two-partner secretion domain-containing protein n=1 Tax=Capilliphycus salinus TaxID=2768948 RepID=UPI0039A59D9C